MNAADELELVLDRISSEYPALVMETLQSVGIDEIPDDCTALADGFCWMVSKHSVFVWSVAAEGDSHQRAVQLPLPPSGLPYSAKSVVVYKNEFSDLPGVLVISGEGVARHFPSLTTSVNDETAIDLASEVTLSVQFLKSSRRACDERFCYVMTFDGAIYCVRLLPKGFEDDLSDDKVFMDDLCNLKDSFSQDDGQLFLFASAFTLFATKNIVEACELMKPLLRKPDNDLVVLVYIFLKHVLDQPVGSQPEKGLNTKKIVCNRTILFLKHMNVYDKVLSTKVLISSLSSSRTGSSILLE
ncbi:hypothetical protein NECAME_06440, partial [Necator americanus]